MPRTTQPQRTQAQRIRLWDLPTRLFHWSLVLLVAAAFVTGQVGGNAMDWHGRIGLAIAGLLAFRLVWGLVGSTYARFASFIPTPAKIRAYLAGNWQGIGHNPLGALSVFALLGLLLLQASTGLFADDDIAFHGHLRTLVDADCSSLLTRIHHTLSNLLLALVALHVGAILFYARVRKKGLVKPMLTGWIESGDPQARPATGGGTAALIVAVSLALLAVYGASGSWIEAPVPAVSAPAPGW